MICKHYKPKYSNLTFNYEELFIHAVCTDLYGHIHLYDKY